MQSKEKQPEMESNLYITYIEGNKTIENLQADSCKKITKEEGVFTVISFLGDKKDLYIPIDNILMVSILPHIPVDNINNH